MKPKTKERKVKAFYNRTHNKLHFTFPNGNSISTIWGAGTYSDNHEFYDESKTDILERTGYGKFMESDTCEIMILNAPEKLIKKIHKKYNYSDSENSVIGYLKIEQWLEILNLLARSPK